MIVKELIEILKALPEYLIVLMWIESSYNGTECAEVLKVEHQIGDTVVTLGDESL